MTEYQSALYIVALSGLIFVLSIGQAVRVHMVRVGVSTIEQLFGSSLVQLVGAVIILFVAIKWYRKCKNGIQSEIDKCVGDIDGHK